MFPKLTIKASNSFNQFGLIAEALIFYQKLNLILDHKSFLEALEFIGYENMIELIKEEDLIINLNSQALGVGNPEGNKYIIGSFSAQNKENNKIITNATESLWGRNIQSNNKKKHLLKLIGEHTYGKDYWNLLDSELLDSENFKDSIVTVSKGKILREKIEIEIKKEDEIFFEIQSNCNKKLIEDAAFLISVGSGLLYDSKVHNSELVTNSSIATYPTSRLKRILDKRIKSEKSIKNFHEYVFPEFYDLNSTIQSGTKQFNDFMDLWREAKKFKNWLKNEEPNIELLTAYIRKLSENSWLDKLPIKTLRWIMFIATGLSVDKEIGGIVGATASLGVDFFENFLLDGIINKKYNPNQFVENEYKDFLNIGI